MTEWSVILLVGFAVVFIGLSKAGFGGGLGMLTTPLCVVAFGMGSRHSLPSVFSCRLCAAILFRSTTIAPVAVENLKYLLPGVVLRDRGHPVNGPDGARHFSLIIGVLAVSFVVFQLVKEKVFKNETPFVPGHGTGTVAGIGAGLTSTFAHGAGPMINIFMIPAIIQGGVCLHACAHLYVD